MKNVFKYILSILIAVNLTAPAYLHAAQLSIANYHPSVYGIYDRIRLLPRSADLTEPCLIGTMYVTPTGIPRYCFNDGTGSGIWGTPPETWSQNGDNIFLTDTSVNTNINVGIGTATPPFKLTIQDDPLIIANGSFGNGATLPDGLGVGSRLIWYPRKAAFRTGYVDSDQWDDVNIGDYSVAMGKNTKASGNFSVATGGENNIASGQYATTVGGQNNIASGDFSAANGGKQNIASGHHAMIYGGFNNQATADYSLIIGGKDNQAIAVGTVIGGGEGNIVSTNYSFIGGGLTNAIDRINDGTLDLGFSVIGGGANNKARHDYSVVLGGENNSAMGMYSSIGGGSYNSIGNLTGLVGKASVISGGQANTVTGDNSIIGGGQNNIVSANYSVVGGGTKNHSTGIYSLVGGGERNIVSGQYSMIMGGTDNIVAGDYSWAGGRYVQISANADHTFAWGYSDDGVQPISVDTPDVFVIAPGRISGGAWNPYVGIQDRTPAAILEVNANASLTDNYISITNPGQVGGTGNIFVFNNNGYIGVNQPTPTVATHLMQFGNANGAYLSTGGVWTNASSRKFKENITPLSSRDAEDALDKLAPVTFNYKITRDQQNIGFIAEEVPDLVAMEGRKSLSTMDIVAVLTKTIKDQEEQIQSHKRDLQDIREKIQKIKERLN